jgi:hypothetical protein
MIAALHTSTISGRFGWHRDGWRDQAQLLRQVVRQDE